jgi:hypothetical protein
LHGGYFVEPFLQEPERVSTPNILANFVGDVAWKRMIIIYTLVTL